MRFCFAIVISIQLSVAQSPTPPRITDAQALFVAKKVWINEGAGKDKFLLWWNRGEEFPSLGIGHFIWYPPGVKAPFVESFPMLLRYLKTQGVKFPRWLRIDSDSPWSDREEFFADRKSKSRRYRELFAFMKRTIPFQARFLALRMQASLPKMLDTIDDPAKRRMIEKRFSNMLYDKNGTVDERGLYILIDYSNFKGEGISKSERYDGYGWGLLQVLENMKSGPNDKYSAFAKSAAEILERRIAHSPPHKNEKRWRKNWLGRVGSYAK